MNTINQLTNLIIGIIGTLSVVRVTAHLVAMILNLDEKEVYKKKIKNCIVAVIGASLVFVIKEIVLFYFG